MRRNDFLQLIKSYTPTRQCADIASYLNRLASNCEIGFTEEVELDDSLTEILNTDSNTYHILFIRDCGYTYVKNDEHNKLRCAMTIDKFTLDHVIYFAGSAKEFCNVLSQRILLHNLS